MYCFNFKLRALFNIMVSIFLIGLDFGNVVHGWTINEPWEDLRDGKVVGMQNSSHSNDSSGNSKQECIITNQKTPFFRSLRCQSFFELAKQASKSSKSPDFATFLCLFLEKEH